MNLVNIKEITKDVYVFTEMKSGFFNNITVVLTKDGPVIIDVFKESDLFEVVKNFINKNGFNEPVAIIYTHWHVDHTCGNGFFNKCKIIGHAATKIHLESFIANDLNRMIQKGILDKDTEILLPTETFEKELLLGIGDKKIKLFHCPGHTYDSILVYLENENVLVAGDNLIGEEIDFFMPPTIPPDQCDAKASDLAVAYDTIQNIHSDIIIPGHGEIMNSEKILEYNRNQYFICKNMH